MGVLFFFVRGVGKGKGKGKGKGEENVSSLLFPSSAEGGGEITVGGSAGRRDRLRGSAGGGRSPGEEIAAGGSAGGDRREKRSPWGEITNDDGDGDGDGERRMATLRRQLTFPSSSFSFIFVRLLYRLGLSFFCYL